jgi:hypothetical protein
MLHKNAVASAIAGILLLACASTPVPPAPEPSSGRAASIIQSGADAGQASATAPKPTTGSAAQDAAGTTSGGSAAKAVTGSTSGNSASQAVAAATAPPADAAPAAYGALSADEKAWLQNYLNRLNYMVYYKDDGRVDPRLAKVAVTQANRYLIEKLGLSVIDFDQIERNKKDQQAAYQAETGGSIDMIQYLAQKFNADVYVELELAVDSKAQDQKYYASAQGTMKVFETSTAALLGSIAFTGQQAFSPSSIDAALSNAIASTIWTTMPAVISQSAELVKNSMQRGLRYEVLIQSTSDSRAVSDLRRALGRKVREVEQVSYSAQETRFYVYAFLPRDWVEDAVYEAATAAGFRNIYLVYSRGKSFTFNSGS